jgi:hypothetical protein
MAPTGRRIRGRFIDATGAEPPRFGIFRAERRDTPVKIDGQSLFNLARRRAGEFELAGFAPGSWYIHAQWREADQVQRYSRLAVEIGDEDLEDVTFVLQRGARVTGQFTRHPAASGDVDFRLLRVIFAPAENPAMFSSSPRPSAVSESGEYSIADAPEGPFFLMNPAGAWFIDSIKLNGEEVLEKGITFEPETEANLEIVVSNVGGSISGTVTEANRPAGGAYVVAMPAGPGRNNPHLYAMTRAQPNGRYSLSRLRPGGYTVIAFKELEVGTHNSREYLEPFERFGKTVGVSPGIAAQVNLEVAPPQ